MDPKKIEDKVVEYLKRDKRGYRLPLLKILLDGKPKTIREIYTILNSMGIPISLQGTSALVGYAYRYLYPLISVQRAKDRYYYSINPSYLPLLKQILTSHENQSHQ